MSAAAGATLGPLEPDGSVAAWRQSRLGSFLVSAYGALARLAAAQALAAPGAAAIALNGAAMQATGIVAAVMRGTAWQPDAWVMTSMLGWEALWLPSPLPPAAGKAGLALDAAATCLAIVTVVRPAPLLPPEADPAAPFAVALALAELEAGRMLQPFLHLLRGMAAEIPPATVEAAAEAKRAKVAEAWQALVASLAGA